jgi:hypothetical protein
MTELAPITNHDEIALNRLLSQFRGKARIEALLKAVAEGVQTLEDLVYDLISSTRFDNAVDAHLDAWGELVGEFREGMSDDDYRRFISARILVNKCEGTTDQIIEIFDIITGDSVVILYNLPGGPNYELYTYRAPGDTLSSDLKAKIGRIMEDIRPAGVGHLVVEVPSGYFGFAEDPGALGFDVGEFAEVF